MVEEEKAVPLDGHAAGHAEGPLNFRCAARGVPCRLVKGVNIEPANGEKWPVSPSSLAIEALVFGTIPVQLRHGGYLFRDPRPSA